ncbi:amino acid adenylation domain-containing protein [Actinoplanes sp. NPDC051851]|uniref:non-ribosomal peptide synthetase n=1 Tax=Actinoplanes sp. NPDC051851 TaxID=3154753 RepID=UPI0034238C72
MNTQTAPVSSLQRGLWFMEQWNPGAATYHTAWTLTFDGPVDPALLGRALQYLAARHEALRTTFSLGPDGPVQHVHADGRIPLDEATTLEQARERAAATRFDLTEGPLLRATLVPEPAALVLVVHHIIWDGWSEELFDRELAATYTALAEGRAVGLPAPATQPAEHALAEARESFEEHREFWRETLDGAPAELTLHAARPRPPAQTFTGRTRPFALPAGTTDRLRALAAETESTPFVVQLAAFAMLIGRHSGARDLVIGTPMTVRHRPELETALGCFVNLVPLRVRLDPGATFRQLVEGVRDTAFDAYAYAELAFDAIVETLGRDRSARHAPLVQVVFGAHATGPEPLRFGAVTATARVFDVGTSKFDLTWSTFDDGELRGEAEYNTDLFDTATVGRLAADWRAVLHEALTDPDTPLWRLAPTDRTPPAGADPGDPARCLHTAFEDAVDRYPDRAALSHGELTLTYAEVDVRANRLAHALIAAGVRRGDRVGLYLDRTPHIVVSILAVLKAGAAYVPVDLTAPAGRAAFVFADTGVEVVVTDRGDDAPAGPWRRLDPAAVPAAPSSRPGVPVSPSDVAYLIFTSGSTGVPKGVAVAHEHVGRLMSTGREHFRFGPADVWTLFHSYAFDWTVWELWGALHHGGRLVVVPYLLSRDPWAFAALLGAERVTMLCLTPSALRQLEAVLPATPAPLPSVRRVMLGGEALDPAVVRRWFARPGAPALCNLYGITETTVHVTTHDLDGAAGFERSLIGDAMPHLAALVLDERLRPCPVGVPGELYIAGHSLAHGYWGRPGLTAQRFVPDPAGRAPGGRLYRTGDVARRLPGGGLEYVGRCDHQVKINGYRIELGEVENAVATHPAVRTCAVTVHREQLAAYVTVEGAAPSLAELRTFLAAALPAYMMPATVTVLDALPTTVNGKVDRASLPSPTLDAPADTPSEAPRSAEETLVAQTFQEVLGIAGAGRADDFFRLGGDSIRAVRLAARLREDGWTLSLPDLFAAPTVAGLAGLLTPAEAGADAPTAEFSALPAADRDAALPGGVVDAYPMVSMQLAMIYHMELSGDAGGYHNVNSYRVRGTLDPTALRDAVAGAMARHPVLRTSFDLFTYSEPLQLVHGRAPVPLDVEDLRGLDDAARHAAVTAVFDELCDTRFDLRTAPLFRVVAQYLADDVFQLTLAEHHAILDGWSFTSLFTEILERHAGPAGPPAAPPETTFRDFVAAEKAAERSPETAAFWHDRLAGATGALFGAPSDEAEVPRTVEHVIPDADRVLRATATAAGVPVKAVALAAHVLALSELTGLRRLTTGLSVNGRLERPGGTDCYGLFLNTVPLPVDLDEAGDGLDLVRHLHRAETALLPHRRMPFARLARFMTGTRLDANFAFLRFHSLGRVTGAAGSIVDDRIGCEPTMRYEPTDFSLGVALVQDPSSGRALLAVDHLTRQVSDLDADRYAAAYLAALARFAAPIRTPATI